MKLYLITKKSLYNHIVSSHVICAENKEEAVKVIEKDNKIYLSGEENPKYFTYHLGSIIWIYCKYLGVASEELEKEVVLSYHNER